MSRFKGLHVCSFVQGMYTVQSPSGKTGLHFEDSDLFGPSKLDAKGNPHPISDRLKWFWDGYDKWRKNGRPVTGKTLSTPFGEIKEANFVI
jgi:hypothetical protein